MQNELTLYRNREFISFRFVDQLTRHIPCTHHLASSRIPTETVTASHALLGQTMSAAREIVQHSTDERAAKRKCKTCKLKRTIPLCAIDQHGSTATDSIGAVRADEKKKTARYQSVKDDAIYCVCVFSLSFLPRLSFSRYVNVSCSFHYFNFVCCVPFRTHCSNVSLSRVNRWIGRFQFLIHIGCARCCFAVHLMCCGSICNALTHTHTFRCMRFSENKNSAESENNTNWSRAHTSQVHTERITQCPICTSIMIEIPPIGGQIKNIFWFCFLFEFISTPATPHRMDEREREMERATSSNDIDTD